MLRYANLYGLFLVQRFKILMEYRVNFIIGASSTIILQMAGLVTIWVVMRQVPTLNGWSLNDVLLIYGLITLAKSLNHMFADNLWTIGRQYIRTGAFDRFLVRPINPLFHLLADRFCHDGIGNFLVGMVLIVYALRAMAIPLTASTLLYLIIAALSGGVIFIALNLITGTSAFWLMDAVPVMRLVFDNHLFAQYPLTIYPKAIGVLLTWLIPYGFASFYPASYLLGHNIGWYAWLAPFFAAILLLIGYQVWKIGLKHYAGTGS
jgi:ABC-2 type transport system permease protein